MKERIVICTPGRLLEHLRDTHGFRDLCAGIKLVVVDESDRMLDVGFHRDAADIFADISRSQARKEKLMNAIRGECENHIRNLQQYCGLQEQTSLIRPRLSKRAQYVDDIATPLTEFDYQTMLFSATVSTKVRALSNHMTSY